MITLELNNNTTAVLIKAIEVLSNGGLVVFPSDTVYGLLVDASNEAAVKKLITFKNRPIGKAISIFVSNIDEASNVVKLNSKKKELLETLIPGPFTIVAPSKDKVSKLLESENGSLGFRVPRYGPINQLSQMFGKPITATSANLGGRHPHYSIESLMNQLPDGKKNLIDLVVDAGKLPRNKPSTVIELRDSEVKILRKGDVNFVKTNEFTSESPSQTRKIASFLWKNIINQNRSRTQTILLKGDLGTGKTEFTRGLALELGLEKIVSPTFVISYEYTVDTKFSKKLGNSYQKLVHVDLYNIQDEEEFKHLGLDNYLFSKNILVIEWGEKLGSVFDYFAGKTDVHMIELQHVQKNKRVIKYGTVQRV